MRLRRIEDTLSNSGSPLSISYMSDTQKLGGRCTATGLHTSVWKMGCNEWEKWGSSGVAGGREEDSVKWTMGCRKLRPLNKRSENAWTDEGCCSCPFYVCLTSQIILTWSLHPRGFIFPTPLFHWFHFGFIRSCCSAVTYPKSLFCVFLLSL